MENVISVMVLPTLEGFVFCLKNTAVTIHANSTDPSGNYLLLDLTFDTKRFTLCTIYRPYNNKPNFYADPS